VCYQHGFLIFRHLFYSKYFLVGCQTIGSHFSDFMIFLLRYTLSFSWPNNLPFSNTWNHWLKIFENKYSEKEKIVRGSAPHFSKGVFCANYFTFCTALLHSPKVQKSSCDFKRFFFNIFFFFLKDWFLQKCLLRQCEANFLKDKDLHGSANALQTESTKWLKW
jgi:hypothetical protein